jgi:hypothetical protein
MAKAHRIIVAAVIAISLMFTGAFGSSIVYGAGSDKAATKTEAKAKPDKSKKSKKSKSAGKSKKSKKKAKSAKSKKKKQAKSAKSSKKQERIWIVCSCGKKLQNVKAWDKHYAAKKNAAIRYAESYDGFFPTDTELEHYEKLCDEWDRHMGWKTSDAL